MLSAILSGISPGFAGADDASKCEVQSAYIHMEGSEKVVNKVYADGHSGYPFCFPFPHSHGCGDGFGAGNMSWLVLLALLGGRGIGWNGDGHGHGHFCDGTGKVLTSIEINKVLDSLNLNNQQIASAKELVAATGVAITNQITQSRDFIAAGIDRLKDAGFAQFTSLKEGQCDIKTEVLKGNFALLTEIKNDGEKTRALIGTDILDRKNDRIRELERRIDDGRHDHRHDVNRLEVNQTVNQAQAQAQQQQQQQVVYDRLGWLTSQLAILQSQLNVQHASNKTVQFGAGNVAVPTNSNAATNVG